MEENELERTESGKIATRNLFGIYPTYKIYRSLDIKNTIYNNTIKVSHVSYIILVGVRLIATKNTTNINQGEKKTGIQGYRFMLLDLSGVS